jgi:tetratricopeptide (TPR) repeat protein
MVTELADIIGLLKLGCIKQALGFVGKLVSNKAQTRESLSEVLNQLYLYSQDVIKQKRFKVALQVLKVLEELSRLLKDPGKMCDVKNTVSFCYRACGLYDQSLTKCLEALEIVSENFSIRSKLPALHLNACAIYREDFKDLINSKIHAELAYYYGKETYTPSESCKRTLAICIYNCGYISDELNDFKSAEKWYKEALEYCAEEWKDQGMIKNLKYKLKNLEMKIKIFSKRLRPLNISEIQLYALKGLNHSPYKSPGKIRLPRSQCSKRPKNYYSNASTPVPLKSTPSNEKSTGPSSPHDPVFIPKYIKIPIY